MSVSEPETLKPDESVVETPPPNSLGNLNAENKALKEQLDTVTQKLAVAEKQIADSERDRPNDDPLRQELETVRGRLKQEIGNYGELAISTKQLTRELNKVRSQLETEQADRQQLQTELAELQQRLDAAEQNPDCAIDLSGKAGELVNFFRTLLPRDTKLPKNTMSKLREILEATED